MVTEYTNIGGVFSVVVSREGTIISTCQAHNKVMGEGLRGLWSTVTTTPLVGGYSWFCGLLDATLILAGGTGDHFVTGQTWSDYWDETSRLHPYAAGLYDPVRGSSTGVTTVTTNKALYPMAWGAVSAGGIAGTCTFPAVTVTPNYGALRGFLIANASNSSLGVDHTLFCTAATSSAIVILGGEVISITYDLKTSPSPVAF